MGRAHLWGPCWTWRWGWLEPQSAQNPEEDPQGRSERSRGPARSWVVGPKGGQGVAGVGWGGVQPAVSLAAA